MRKSYQFFEVELPFAEFKVSLPAGLCALEGGGHLERERVPLVARSRLVARWSVEERPLEHEAERLLGRALVPQREQLASTEHLGHGHEERLPPAAAVEQRLQLINRSVHFDCSSSLKKSSTTQYPTSC